MVRGQGKKERSANHRVEAKRIISNIPSSRAKASPRGTIAEIANARKLRHAFRYTTHFRFKSEGKNSKMGA